jgi:hypothetical protein
MLLLDGLLQTNERCGDDAKFHATIYTRKERNKDYLSTRFNYFGILYLLLILPCRGT